MQPSHTGDHIVVGVDGSETSLAAAAWATTFAGALALPIQLVHSSPAPGPLPDIAVTPEELAQRQRAYCTELLSAAETTVRRWAPDVGVRTVAATDAPAAGLLKAAEGAAMIVLGATGAGSVERWILGSTALRVAGQAHCPVAVWRGDPANPLPDDRPIVVGSDGSPVSAAATELAFDWARLLSVPVVPVRSWTDSSAIGASVPTAMQVFGPTAMVIDWEMIARSEAETLATIIAPYRKKYPGVVVEERSRRGSAARELLRALDDAQMVIVGNKGWGRLRGVLLGSTSQNLLHRAERPVVVCRGVDV